MSTATVSRVWFALCKSKDGQEALGSGSTEDEAKWSAAVLFGKGQTFDLGIKVFLRANISELFHLSSTCYSTCRPPKSKAAITSNVQLGLSDAERNGVGCVVPATRLSGRSGIPHTSVIVHITCELVMLSM